MGGYGSGQKWGSKDTVAEHKRIDVLWMQRQGYLVANASGSLTWSRNGETYATINYRTGYNAIRLIYKSRPYGGEWKDVDYSTPITWDSCRFGGNRPYFICQGLGCGKRVQHLYGGNPYFVCRHCLKLAYSVQREVADERAARRADKIRAKLGAEPGILNELPYFKPKGMHQKTFDRLRHEASYYTDVCLRGAALRIGFKLEDLTF